MDQTSLTVIIVSWNTKDLLDRCLVSLHSELDQSPGLICQVVVVDNASKDGSADMVASRHAWVKLIANKENLGFAKANNQVLNKLTTEFVLLLNPDTEIVPGAVSLLVEFLKQHPKAGIVAPQLINSDGSIQRFARSFPTATDMLFELLGLAKLFPKAERFKKYKLLDFDFASQRQVDQPGGACMLIRRSVLDTVGVFDERFFMLFEEVDLCYRIKQAGTEIWFYPEAKVIHHLGQSIKQVKARMIYFSHRSFYLYMMKRTQSRTVKLLGPVIYLGLMVLAGLRIGYYFLRHQNTKPA